MLQLIEGESPMMALAMLTAALVAIGLACLLMAGMAVVIADFVKALRTHRLRGEDQP